MENQAQDRNKVTKTQIWQFDLIFGLLLFAAGVAALLIAFPSDGVLAGEYSWGTALFFLVFGVFTITMGYARPGFGHVSFDRVAQISSIIVLGPYDAAWINGLASLIFPLHRVWKNVPLRDVAVAALHNSGMMIAVILACGSLFVYLGGPVPLSILDLRTGGLLLLLMLSMQGMNDALMAIMMYLRKTNPTTMMTVFSFSVELAAALLAIIVAIVFVEMQLAVCARNLKRWSMNVLKN